MYKGWDIGNIITFDSGKWGSFPTDLMKKIHLKDCGKNSRNEITEDPKISTDNPLKFFDILNMIKECEHSYKTETSNKESQIYWDNRY